MKPIKKVKSFKKSEDKQFKAKPNRPKGKLVGKKKSGVPHRRVKEMPSKADGAKMPKLEVSEEQADLKQPELKGILKRRSQTASNNSSPASKADKNCPVDEEKTEEPIKVKSSGKKRGAATSKHQLEDSPEEKQQNVKKPRLNSSKQNLDGGIDKKRESSTGENKMVLGDKFNDEKSIKEEEERRRQDRNEKSIFLKDVRKKMSASDLKALHPDVVAVRVVAKNAWLIFSSKSARAKAYGAISSKKIDGKPIVADFCGSEAKNANKEGKPVQTCMADRPVDFLEIVVSGLPIKTTKKSLHTIFPRAAGIRVVADFRAQSAKAFIRFEDKQFAREAFASGANMVIGEFPVDVFYSRKMIPTDKKLEPENKQSKKQSEEDPKKIASSQVKDDNNSSSEDGDGGEQNDHSSDGGSDDYGSDSSEEEESGEGSFEDDSGIQSSEEGSEESSD